MSLFMVLFPTCSVYIICGHRNPLFIIAYFASDLNSIRCSAVKKNPVLSVIFLFGTVGFHGGDLEVVL